MKKVLGVLAGLVIFLAPIYAWITNYRGLGVAAWNFLKGGAIWISLFVGFGLLVASLLSLKD